MEFLGHEVFSWFIEFYLHTKCNLSRRTTLPFNGLIASLVKLDLFTWFKKYKYSDPVNYLMLMLFINIAVIWTGTDMVHWYNV